MNAVLSAFLSKQATQMCFSSSGFTRRLPVRLPSTLKRLSMRASLSDVGHVPSVPWRFFPVLKTSEVSSMRSSVVCKV